MELLKDYIYKVNIIPEELCNFIIEDCESQNKWELHAWATSNTTEVNSYDNKELDVVMSTPQQHNILAPYIRTALDSYEATYNKLDGSLSESISVIRFNKYTSGTIMREHYDHIKSLFDGKIRGIPVLSIIGNLNKEYEGGDLYIRDKKIQLTTGDILIFPSNFMYPHKVIELTQGTRYSFVSWAF